MEFETVERCGRIHVVKNGVESAVFVRGGEHGWEAFFPEQRGRGGELAKHLEIISILMGDWHTATQAAAWLVEKGVFDKPPTAHDICLWARNGLLPGAVKISAPGQGGSWRIPASALAALAERRKGR